MCCLLLPGLRGGGIGQECCNSWKFVENSRNYNKCCAKWSKIMDKFVEYLLKIVEN